MSLWEAFTWINAAVLGLGSIIVFILFLRQLKNLIPRGDARRVDSERR